MRRLIGIPKQAIADGTVVIEQNVIKNMEMADKFK
jgi:hypothetical protein